MFGLVILRCTYGIRYPFYNNGLHRSDKQPAHTPQASITHRWCQHKSQSDKIAPEATTAIICQQNRLLSVRKLPEKLKVLSHLSFLCTFSDKLIFLTLKANETWMLRTFIFCSVTTTDANFLFIGKIICS